MLKTKSLISLMLTIAVLTAQVGMVLAAPGSQGDASIDGTVRSITLQTDVNTGITIVLVNVLKEDISSQSVRVNLETAFTLGLVTLDGDGNPMLNNLALGQPIEIGPAQVIPDGGNDRHPIGSALAAFFSDLAGVDYETIMAAHAEGTGFGLIAQALWMTRKFDGDSVVFLAILEAKKTNDYSAFILEDGTTPKNWGQLRKAMLDSSEQPNLGIILSGQDNGDANNNGNGNGNGNEDPNGNNSASGSHKDKDKNNNGKGQGKNK